MEKYISKDQLIKLIEEKQKNGNSAYTMKDLLNDIESLDGDRVIPLYMYRKTEFSKNKAEKQLQRYESGLGIVRCDSCRYAKLVDGSKKCQRFHLNFINQFVVPDKGFCAWGEE